MASAGTLISALSIATQSPFIFPRPHCPCDDVLGEAERPGSSRHYSVKSLWRFLFFSFFKEGKQNNLREGPQLHRDWESCSSAFKSNCSSSREGTCDCKTGGVKAVSCVRNKIGVRAWEKERLTAETVTERNKILIMERMLWSSEGMTVWERWQNEWIGKRTNGTWLFSHKN